jgi:DNA-binding response OmpR family regulator
MTLLRFPTPSPAAGDGWTARRDASPAVGTVLVVTAPDQGLLPNLGLAGVQATFADSMDACDGMADADVLLICAGARRSPEFQENVRTAQARGIPVIVWGELTTEERVATLEAGVQDVIATTCHPLEFRARLQVQLRQRQAPPPAAPWRLSIASRSLVSPDGSVLHFSGALTQIMRMLIEADGAVVRREELAGAFYETLTNRALDAQVCRLRRKLAAHGCRMSLQGVKGLGYSLQFLEGPVLIEGPPVERARAYPAE